MSVLSGSRLEERLVACLPAATFEMETLCRLAGVVESLAVPTAAVECVARPRLLLNPDFVAERCGRDEHLFLLVMHELWHVILAHTSLYPRVTPAHNIAFDAVINAGLVRQFGDPEYRGFFEELNPADEFPGRLLRPPAGWPRAPKYRGAGPAGTAALLRRLYPEPGSRDDGDSDMPLYEEILALLERGGDKAMEEPFLLGNHDNPEAEARAIDDPLFGETVRRIVATWPPPPIPLGGRDAGGASRDWLTALEPPPPDTRAVFARVLRRVLGRRPGPPRRARAEVAIQGGLGVLPSGIDRLRPSRQALGLPTTLWTQPAVARARVLEPPASAHVYLDVSGSMQGLLPKLCGLIVPYVGAGRARVYQFSTEVSPLCVAELQRGELETTLGTDAGCLFAHALSTPRLRRMLILTDGYTGTPGDEQRLKLAERGIAVHVVLPADSAWEDDLAPIAASMTILPPLHERNT